MRIDHWLSAVFFALLSGAFLFAGLLFAIHEANGPGQKGPGLWFALAIATAAAIGLGFTCRKIIRGPTTADSLKRTADQLREERLQAIDQLLAQNPPRLQIPKGFQGANLLPNYATAIGLLVLGQFPLWTILFTIYSFSWDDMNLSELGFFELFYGAATAIMYILASILWVVFLWLRISERLRRRKILRDGRLVEGRVAAVKSCGQWEKVLFAPPDETCTQYRALLDFPWEGDRRQAHQFVYDKDTNTNGHFVPAGMPVRLLVHPIDPRHVIWIEATFLPAPLRYSTLTKPKS